jgi:hypothetical protein
MYEINLAKRAVEMLKAIVSGLLAGAVFSGGAAWAADADFKLVNRTGYEISEIYISPTQRKQWGRDRMGEHVLKNNFSKVFRFGDTRNCRQDIRVVFSDGDTVEWDDINLCRLSQVTLRYNRKKGEVWADTE